MNKAALLVVKSLKISVGSNHGEAFGALTESEQDSSLLSGFLDDEHSVFTYENKKLYLKEIVCLRHCEPQAEQKDPGLTENGRSQSKRAAFFVDENFQDFEVFASPQKRCVETGMALSNATNIVENLNDVKKNEKINVFQERVASVLDDLPSKSIIISHCNFIQTLLELMTGQVIPKVHYGEMTYVNINQILWTKHEFYLGNTSADHC